MTSSGPLNFISALLLWCALLAVRVAIALFAWNQIASDILGVRDATYLEAITLAGLWALASLQITYRSKRTEY